MNYSHVLFNCRKAHVLQKLFQFIICTSSSSSSSALLLPQQRDERILGDIDIRHGPHLLLALRLLSQQLHPPGHVAAVLKEEKGKKSDKKWISAKLSGNN